MNLCGRVEVSSPVFPLVPVEDSVLCLLSGLFLLREGRRCDPEPAAACVSSPVTSTVNICVTDLLH